MRITPSMQYSRFLESLRSIRERLADGHAQLASQRKLERPSDDPVGAAEALLLRTRIAAVDRYAANSSVARAFLDVTESALSSVGDLLTQARAAAVRGASDTNAGVRSEIADEVDSIRTHLLSVARTSFQGRYIFSGTDTTTPAYDDAGVYRGNDGRIRVESSDSDTTTLNLVGTEVFGAQPADALAALASLSASLRAGDTAAIQGSIESLEGFRRLAATARTSVGERMVRLEGSLARNGDARVALLSRLSKIEDADLAEVAVRLASDRTAEEATLAAGARLSSRSLFDYLT